MVHRFRILAALVVIGFGLAHAQTARADLITQWNLIAITEINAQGGALAGPNPATRALAITHAAIYDVVANFDKSHVPYLVTLEPPETASVEAAVAGAAYYALAVLLPARRTALNQHLNDALDAAPGDQAAIDTGYDFGVEVADRILDARGGDGSTVTKTAPGSTDLGAWRPISSAAADAALEPGWRLVRPFAISKPSAFRPSAPPALGSAAYIAAVEEVRSLGASAATAVTTSVTRSATQTEIADFWKQPTHLPFNAIARQVVNARDLELEESARLFAQLEIALADSRIAAWDAKYEYQAWRPYHAIRVDDGAGQTITGTTLDPDWTPYLPTPAHPDYPSGHSTTSAAAAAVLAAWFGEDVGFTVASDTLPGVTRAFASFSQATEENGRSRIYGGIHFQFANSAGQTLGRKVGHYVVDSLFGAVVPAAPDAGANDDDAGEPFDAGGGNAGSTAPDVEVADASQIDSGAHDAGRPPAAEPDAARPDAARPPQAERDAGRPPYLADAGEDAHGHDADDDGCAAVSSSRSTSSGFGSLALAALALAWLRRRRMPR